MRSLVSNWGYNSRSHFAQPDGKYCAILGFKEQRLWNFLHWFPPSLLQVTLRNKIVSWMEQRRSSEFLMDQSKEIALLPVKQMHAVTVKNSALSFYFCALFYHLIVFYDPYLTSWTNIQLCPCCENRCLSVMTIMWYYHSLSFSSIVKAESSDWVCRLGCVIITNKSWHFNGESCTWGVPLIMLI